METTKEWLQSLNDDQVTPQEAEILIDELAKELAIAEATPKPINDEYVAVRRALENLKNNPTVTQNNPREFNYQTYLSTDEKAKEIIVKYLTKNGFVITEDKETYGTDIWATKDGIVQGFEVEISSLDFDKTNFQYDNVSFLARKEKYRTKGEFNYIIISSNHQYALTASSQDIFNKENYMTKYAGNGRDGVDEFYQLPKNQVKFFKINLTK
jgi:hypothetical protein